MFDQDIDPVFGYHPKFFYYIKHFLYITFLVLPSATISAIHYHLEDLGYTRIRASQILSLRNLAGEE
jgi:hypothetical protein